MSESTNQVRTPPNPSGKGGFGDNPQNRNPGGWDKRDSISYQYNKLIRMTDEELVQWEKEILEAKKATQAQKAAYRQVKASVSVDEKVSLPSVKEITDRTEGKAPQFIGLGGEEDYKKALVEFVGEEKD